MLDFLIRTLNWFFGPPEEINGANRCPTYLYRWQLLSTRWGKIYLHRFVATDWSRDLHDHPKRFLSIGLRGSYLEETPAGFQLFKAPWVRTFPANHIHRIAAISAKPNPWTLVVVFWAVREWGFWHDGRFIPWKKYVEEKGGIADRMKQCD